MKPRAPLSTDQALARIAGQLPGGFVEMARILDRSESLVRGWSDPDRRERIPMDDAITLDLAYRAAGGDGSPLFDSYAVRLDLAAAARFSEQFNLLALTEGLSKETGEGITALIGACHPDAGPAERKRALKEVADVLEPIRAILNALEASGQPGNPANAQPP